MAKGASRARATVADTKTEQTRIAELTQKTLDGLYSVGRPSSAMRVAVHGDHGVGKTTLLRHCPGVFFLPVEDGANQLRVPQWKEPIDSLAAFDQALSVLRHSRHDFKAVAIETLAALEELIKSAIESRLKKTAGKDDATSLAELNEDEFGAGYDLLRDEWRRILGRLDELREHRGMHILLSCPTKIDTVKRLNAPDYQRHGMQITGKKSANLIKGWCDYVLFLEMEVNVAKDGRRIITSLGDRVIRCTQQASHDAKCRGDIPWPDTLPFDQRGGWATFVETADLITSKGADLALWLQKEFARAADTIMPQIENGRETRSKEDRRVSATKIFDAAIGSRDYRMAKSVVDMIDEERAAKTTKAQIIAESAAVLSLETL